MSARLKNKIALVTGAAKGGIGSAICDLFSAEGATIIASDINTEGLQQTVDAITAAGGRAIAKYQDVTDPQSWTDIVNGVVDEFGGLDILINNAGIVHAANIEIETLEGWKNMQKVNSESVFLGTQAGVRAMKSKGGSIINISSIMGLVADEEEPAYNASKGAVRLMSKSAALHCAAKDYGVRVNSVHPGFIETPLISGAAARMKKEDAEKIIARIYSNIPMKKMGKPDDIANACLYLASDESAYVTGSELVVDGGYTCR